MKTPYVEARKRADGTPYWIVNPPKRMKDALGVAYSKHATEDAAVSEAQRVIAAYKVCESSPVTGCTTVHAIVEQFYDSRAFKDLAPGSQKNYRQWLNAALAAPVDAKTTLGQYPARTVISATADAVHAHLSATKSAHLAFYAVRTLCRVWNVAKRLDLVSLNPWEKMGLQAPADRVVLWEPDHATALIAAADAKGWPSMGTLVLMCYDLCQRPGDMLSLQWRHLRDGTFVFRQQKTGVRVEIPASPRLLHRLGTPHNPDYFIIPNPVSGRPMTTAQMRYFFNILRKDAGLPETVWLADLRRTGATEMAEAGCTEDELRSVTGHQSRDVLSIYVRPTRQLARNGVLKRFA